MREYSSLELDFKDQVAQIPGGERVSNCFLCGTCTAGCPVSELDPQYNPRKIMNQILTGSKKDVLESPDIWKCMQCHVCVSHCPQDVRFADVLRALRTLAVQEGCADAAFVGRVDELDRQLRRKRLDEIVKMTNQR